MSITQQNGFEIAQNRNQDYDVQIQVGYAAFAIMLLIAVYLGSIAAGAAPGEFAAMTVFP